MAVKSSQINTTDQDFDDIVSNIKSYLKGQELFKDYNFEGSTMSVLIDMLAYASHIGAINTNIAASEMFLDSAQLRKNVVSRAKDLGFVPASEKASAAYVNMQMDNVVNADGTIPTPSDMTLSRGQQFTTIYDNVAYNFVCTSSITPTRSNKSFNWNNIELVQGQYVTDQFVFDSQIKNSKFVLSNERVDKSKLVVTVISNGVEETYVDAKSISTISSSSKVFYTQENEEGFVEFYFGDGVLGNQLLDGDIINAVYVVVDLEHAEGAKRFTLTQPINGFISATVTTVTEATGGAEKESIDSIKFKATKFYTSQNRLVTLNDYKAKVSEYYPNADAVAVWGGEDNDPPDYGKVFLSLKPQNSDYLSEFEKADVIKKLNALNMVTVKPVIVDADIVKILVTTVFKYDSRATQLSIGEMKSVVRAAIVNFDNTNLSNFDSIFRHSKLVKAIDESEGSILSNSTNIRLRKSQKVELNKQKGLEIKFGNGFYHPHDGHNKAGGGILVSSGFKVQGDSVNDHFFDDDGSGKIRRYVLASGVRTIKDYEAGTIDYGTGKITIDAITITGTTNSDTSIDFTVLPSSNDVVAVRGSLIDISVDDINVDGEVDTIASGESSAGVGYTSTSNTNY